jgi:transcriptional regulator of acetoin/glycerol metabolism
VTGCPSQFPFFRQRTGFLINLTDVKGMNSDRETTVDQRIRDQIIFFSFSVNTRSLTYVLALALLNDDRTVGAQAHASLVAPRDHSVPINSAYQTSHSSDGTPWRP